VPTYFSQSFTLVEDAHGLPAGVLDAVIQHESGGDPNAFRFEPDFYARYIRGVGQSLLGGSWPLAASDETERMGRGTSWGLMQVMGQVAREQGFDLPFFPALCSVPGLGVEFGARQLAAKLRAYGNLPDALSAYNAGQPTLFNRSSYVEPILARMKGAAS